MLYINKNFVYKKGYNLDIVPNDEIELTHDENFIHIKYTGKTEKLIIVTVDKLWCIRLNLFLNLNIKLIFGRI